MIKQAERAKSWYKLDNAAKIYPAVWTERWAGMYRISMTLQEPIDPSFLQRAAEDTLMRFPSMNVRLKRGFFWFYFEQNDTPFTVQKEAGHPLMPFKRSEKGRYLVRVLYYDCRICVEIFHALTDGTGALMFLKTLVARYLFYKKGLRVPAELGIKDTEGPPDPGELEDAYSRVPLDGPHFSRKEAAAYRMPGNREMPHTLHVVIGEMSAQSVKLEAKKRGVSVNEYLVAVFLYCLSRMQARGRRDTKRPVKISVPVNMRRFLPSSTVRNFAFYINMGLDPCLGAYTFDEVVQMAHHYLRYYLNPKFLFAGIATNVASERNPFVRAFPLFIKNWVLASVYRRVGERLWTTVLTNLGTVEVPECMRQEIRDVRILLGSAYTGRSNAACVTLNDTLALCFSRNIREAAFEKEVLSFLVEQGIPVTVSSNQE